MLSTESLKRSLKASACQIHNSNRADFSKSLKTDGGFECPVGDLTKGVVSGEENSSFFKHRSFIMLLARPQTAFGELVPTQV